MLFSAKFCRVSVVNNHANKVSAKLFTLFISRQNKVQYFIGEIDPVTSVGFN